MPPESNVESTLVWYKAADEGNVNYWTNELDTFLEGKIYLCINFPYPLYSHHIQLSILLEEKPIDHKSRDIADLGKQLI